MASFKRFVARNQAVAQPQLNRFLADLSVGQVTGTKAKSRQSVEKQGFRKRLHDIPIDLLGPTGQYVNQFYVDIFQESLFIGSRRRY
jgi:hypothetical protein